MATEIKKSRGTDADVFQVILEAMARFQDAKPRQTHGAMVLIDNPTKITDVIDGLSSNGEQLHRTSHQFVITTKYGVYLTNVFNCQRLSSAIIRAILNGEAEALFPGAFVERDDEVHVGGDF